MKVGDKVIRTPTTIGEGMPVGTLNSVSSARPMRGTVVWIHPKGRFHVVEFEVCGRTLRESFLGVE
jgi:hypothetical protein